MEFDMSDEHMRLAQELDKIKKRITSLCNEGKYDEAEIVVNNEYSLLEAKWKSSFNHFLRSMIKRE
jgi:hypothetical protein